MLVCTLALQVMSMEQIMLLQPFKSKVIQYTRNYNYNYFYVIFITIVPPTLIDDGLRNITTAAGDDVTLFCNATGYPPPTIVWFKNDVVLSEERELSADGVFITNFTHDVTSTASYLYIPGVDRSDNGLYHCQSYNDLVRVITVTAMKVSLQILSTPLYIY